MFASIHAWLKSHPVIAFFFLTFALAWALWVPVGVFAPDYLLLASLPGVWAPTASALLLTGLTDGKAGLRQFIARLFKWRVGIQWYAVVLFGVAAVAYVAIGLHVLLGGAVPPITLPPGIPQEAWLVALPLLFLINIFVGGPLAEDVGWRGYALPKLRAHTNALNASLIIGVIWVLWHLPFFLFPQTASVVGGIPFVWFALLTTAWSVLFAWVYVNTGSILMPVLFHAAINTTLGTLGLLGQTAGDLTALILNVILTWVVVGVVAAIFGPDLGREFSLRRMGAGNTTRPGSSSDTKLI